LRCCLYNLAGRFFCTRQKTQETSYRAKRRHFGPGHVSVTKHTLPSWLRPDPCPDFSAEVTRQFAQHAVSTAISGIFAIREKSRRKEYIAYKTIVQAVLLNSCVFFPIITFQIDSESKTIVILMNPFASASQK
jgi:hypothetical protein